MIYSRPYYKFQIEMDILNLASTKTDQAFDSNNEGALSVQQNDIHVRIQQRSGRKTLTTIQGEK